MRARNETKKIVIHGAFTKPSMDVDARWIRNIHVNENGWDDIGYHFVITREGVVEKGRSEAMMGAHCPKVNATSVAICLAGGMSEDGEAENNYTEEQWLALHGLVEKLMEKYKLNPEDIMGHYEYANHKTCPTFDMNRYRTAIQSPYAIFVEQMIGWDDYMGSVKYE